MEPEAYLYCVTYGELSIVSVTTKHVNVHIKNLFKSITDVIRDPKIDVDKLLTIFDELAKNNSICQPDDATRKYLKECGYDVYIYISGDNNYHVITDSCDIITTPPIIIDNHTWTSCGITLGSQ